MALTVAFSLVACAGPDNDSKDGDANLVYGTAPAAVNGVPSAILLDPEPAADGQRTLEPAVMDQIAMMFTPRLLVVRPGQPVEFRNSEDVAHNVRIRAKDSDSTVLNEGTATGEPVHHSFDRAGGYHVTCDVHPGMTAFILVTPHVHSVVAASDGSFETSGVPPGRYRLTVWSLDEKRRTERSIVVRPGRTRIVTDSLP